LANGKACGTCYNIGMRSIIWNPWHGCHKISAGCAHCYVYRRDASCGRRADTVVKTGDFYLPMRRDRSGAYKIPQGSEVDTCFTSDFFVEDADPWRAECWEMMKIRSDLSFFFITKRIDRMEKCLPPDWGETGYPNVSIACTVENQAMADYRLPIYLKMPLAARSIVCSPLLEKIELKKYLDGTVTNLTAAGESGNMARVCDYEWVLDLRRQCVETNTSFYFMQTGALFRKDGKIYRIERKIQHSQARKAKINFIARKPCQEGDNLL
jgi:Bacteriophage protein gp37